MLVCVSRFEVWSDLTHSLLEKAASLKCLLPEQVVTRLSRHLALHSSLARYLTVFPHLLKHVDQGNHALESINHVITLTVRCEWIGNYFDKF